MLEIFEKIKELLEGPFDVNVTRDWLDLAGIVVPVIAIIISVASGFWLAHGAFNREQNAKRDSIIATIYNEFKASSVGIQKCLHIFDKNNWVLNQILNNFDDMEELEETLVNFSFTNWLANRNNVFYSKWKKENMDYIDLYSAFNSFHINCKRIDKRLTELKSGNPQINTDLNKERIKTATITINNEIEKINRYAKKKGLDKIAKIIWLKQNPQER